MSRYSTGPKRKSQYDTLPKDVNSSRNHMDDTGSVYSQPSEYRKGYPKKGQTLAGVELSPDEQEHLENVLSRFDQFKQIEEERIKSLQNELVKHQKQRIKNSESSGDGHCYNCGRLFMILFNPPNVCSICNNEFCRICLHKLPKTNEDACKFCHVESVQRSKLGVWFMEELKVARTQKRVRGVSGPDALRSSLVRLKRESKASSIFQKAHKQDVDNISRSETDLRTSEFETTSVQIIDKWIRETTGNQGSLSGDRTSKHSEQSIPEINLPSEEKRPTSVTSHSSGRSKSMMSLASGNRNSNHETGSRSGAKDLDSTLGLQGPKIFRRHRQKLGSEFGSQNSLSTTSLKRSTRPSSSMLSIYSERDSSYLHGIQITGELLLIIQYDEQSGTLRIGVKQARDLATVNQKHQTSNPYVKAYLLPDKTKPSKRRTGIQKHTRNPVFEEEMKYRIPFSELISRTLQISVWHKKSVGTDYFLGEVIIPFADFHFDSDARWYRLNERRQIIIPTNMQIYRGDVMLALKLNLGGDQDTQCELHVWVKSAKGLTTTTSSNFKNTTVNAYTKVYLLPDKETKHSKQKTPIIKRTNDPEWNTTLVYKNINRNNLNQMGLEVSIWDHERLSSNDFLGGCRLNDGSLREQWMDATGTEQSIWLAILEHPQTWLEASVRLRANLD